MSTAPPADGEVRQLLVHPAVWPRLEQWLTSCGIELRQLPLEVDLPTYVMTPRGLDQSGIAPHSNRDS